MRALLSQQSNVSNHKTIKMTNYIHDIPTGYSIACFKVVTLLFLLIGC